MNEDNFTLIYLVLALIVMTLVDLHLAGVI